MRAPQKVCRHIIILKGQCHWYFPETYFFLFIIAAEKLFIRIVLVLWEHFVGPEWSMSIASWEERVKIMSIFMQSNRIPFLSSSQTVFYLVMMLRDYSLCIQRKIHCLNYINILCHLALSIVLVFQSFLIISHKNLVYIFHVKYEYKCI